MIIPLSRGSRCTGLWSVIVSCRRLSVADRRLFDSPDHDRLEKLLLDAVGIGEHALLPRLQRLLQEEVVYLRTVPIHTLDDEIDGEFAIGRVPDAHTDADQKVGVQSGSKTRLPWTDFT